MTYINFSYSNALPFINKHELKNMEAYVRATQDVLHKKSVAGSESLGWPDLPDSYDTEEFSRIKKAAEKIKKDSDVLLVIGIGGSYLGARAAIDMLSHSFSDILSQKERKAPQIIFAGQHLSSRSEEHTSELQSRGHIVCRLLLEIKKKLNLSTRLMPI